MDPLFLLIGRVSIFGLNVSSVLGAVVGSLVALWAYYTVRNPHLGTLRF